MTLCRSLTLFHFGSYRDAASVNLPAEDSGLPSDPIRQVKEIPGVCVRDEIPGASFLSISLT